MGSYKGQGQEHSSEVLQPKNKGVVRATTLMQNTRKAFTEVVIFQFFLLIL